MKNSFLLIIFVGLALSAYWNHRLEGERKENALALEKARTESARLEHDVIDSRNQTQMQIEGEKKAIQNLDQKMTTLKVKISELRSQLGGMNEVPLGGNNPTTLQWDIQHQKDLVSDLERQQKLLRSEEGEINNRKKSIQGQEKAARSQNERALQNQIQAQEEVLRTGKGRLLQARRDHATVDVIQALQNQVNDQQLFVNQLRGQRDNLRGQWNQNTNTTQGQAQAAIGEVKSDEEVLSERVTREKNHLRDLEKSLTGEEKSANQYKGELSKSQRELQSDNNELTRLQNERDGHSRRLSTLQSN